DGAEAVGASIAAADDDDALTLGGDEVGVGDRVTRGALVLEGQVLHGEVDARELAPRHREIPRVAGTAGQDECVEGVPELRDGDVVDLEHTRALARRGAEPARPLGEVVRRVQALDRLAPVALVHEVVPVGDDVPEGAALVAERDAAVHTPRRLLLELVLREGEIDLLPVADPLLDRARRPLLALDLEKPGDLTHSWPRRARRTSARAPRPAPAPPRAGCAGSPSASP